MEGSQQRVPTDELAGHALLGLLRHKPGYQYELGNRLELRLGPTWGYSSGQLSRVVKKLAAAGLVELVDGVSGPRKRKMLRITDLGAAAVDQWWDGSPEPVRLPRRKLLLKLILAGPERLGETLEQIKEFERDCAKQLNEVSQLLGAVPEGGARVRADHVMLRLGLSWDVNQLEGDLKWAKDARGIVRSLMSGDVLWPSAGERSEALSEKDRERRNARKDLFGRMADKPLHSLPKKLDDDRVQ